jgi:hypothetical protein
MVSKLLIVVLTTIFLVGCGAANYNVPSAVTEDKIINNDQMAYAIFSTEALGAGRGDPIFEYFPKTQTFKLVTIITSYQKYIYPMPAGTHYFYSMGGETYDFVKIKAAKGKKYYINIDTVFWSFRMTTPIEFVPTTDKDVIQEIEKRALIQNNAKTQAWYYKRKDNPKFKAKVKERFEDWKEDDMKDKTLLEKDGFNIK